MPRPRCAGSREPITPARCRGNSELLAPSTRRHGHSKRNTRGAHPVQEPRSCRSQRHTKYEIEPNAHTHSRIHYQSRCHVRSRQIDLVSSIRRSGRRCANGAGSRSSLKTHPIQLDRKSGDALQTRTVRTSAHNEIRMNQRVSERESSERMWSTTERTCEVRSFRINLQAHRRG